MLHTTTQNSVLLSIDNLNENNGPTINSILSTHYNIVYLSNEFYSWSCQCNVNHYHGLISVPQNTCDQLKHE